MNHITKRVTAIFLCVSMLLSLFSPFITVGGAGAIGEVTILSQGQEVKEITITQEEKTELQAVYNKNMPLTYQWQILADVSGEKIWVNISGETGEFCSVSYAMVANMLQNGQAGIRCSVKDGQEIAYSKAVSVRVADPVKCEEPAARRLARAAAAPAAEAGEETQALNLFTVTIQYLYPDGTEAYAPYTTTWEAGSSFSVEVVSPQIVGYKPYRDGEDATKVTLTYSNISQDDVVQVYYEPQPMSYRVEHLLQNIMDDNYIIFKTEHKTGYVGGMTEAEAQEYVGFQSMPFNNLKIAADGSTVIEIYYDRLYYLLTLKLEDGYGLESMYARYGTPIPTTEPIRAGYTFAGWLPILKDPITDEFLKNPDGSYQVGGTKVPLPDTIPDEQMGFVAQWEAQTTTYTVVYLAENPDDEGYSFWGYRTVSAESGSIVSGKDDVAGAEGVSAAELDYFTYNDERTDKNVIVKGDSSTIVEVYYERKEYTIRFHLAKETSNGNRYISTNASAGDHDKEMKTAMDDVTDAVWNEFISGTETEVVNGTTYYFYRLTAKYNENIADEWPSSGVSDITEKNKAYEFVSWGTDGRSLYYQENSTGKKQDIKGPYERMDSKLIISATSDTPHDMFANFSDKAYEFTYEIYFEEPDADLLAPPVYPATPTYTYTIHSIANESQQTGPAFEGMKFVSKEGSNPIRFYYTRNDYELYLHNHGSAEAQTQKLPYGLSLKAYSAPPAYPSGLPANAYTFEGWYTTTDFLPGTEFAFENMTMPAANLTLYASWQPKKFTLQFYQTAKLDTPVGDPVETFYGAMLTPPPIPQPPYPGMILVGWFYKDGTVEKAINFDEFRVRKNIDIYAKWTTPDDIPYMVKYVIAPGEEGAGTEIAAPTKGFAKGGYNRTFEAKTGVSLYPAYQNDYYPLTNSHTIVMDPSPEADNTYVFEYVKREVTEYRVRYLDTATGYPLAEEKVVFNNRSTVVIENYLYVEGYTADAFSKRLTISANAEENIITFWYTKNGTSKLVPCTISHYLQNAEMPENYILYQTVDAQGIVGNLYSLSVLLLDGYAFDETRITVKSYDENGAFISWAYTCNNGVLAVTIPPRGVMIDLYYGCAEYPFEVRHIDYKTGAAIVPAETGRARYGTILSRNALGADILPSYYEVYGEETQTCRIAIEEGNMAVVNVITFYYQEKQVTYRYIPIVHPATYTDFGTVSIKNETVAIHSGQGTGSKPMVRTGFVFRGWYLDEACTLPVSGSDVYKGYLQGESLVPQKGVDGMYDISLAEYGEIIFYALFEPDAADFTITKSGADDATQVFVYKIEGNDLSIEVTIMGNGSVTIRDLPCGEYTVTEDNGWSWRYNNGQNISKPIDHAPDAPALLFAGNTAVPYWIDGHSAPTRNKKETGDA